MPKCVAMITARPLMNPLISVFHTAHNAVLSSFRPQWFHTDYTTLTAKDDKAARPSQTIVDTTQWEPINHLTTLKQMNGSSQGRLLLYYAPLFLLSNEPYISCSAVPFDWCLKVMWHYYGPANHPENTPIHSRSEWSAPTCVFTRLWRPGESFLSQGGNSSSVARAVLLLTGAFIAE